MTRKWRTRASGHPTAVEQAFVKQMVEEHGAENIPINTLHKLTHRRASTIKKMILKAKEDLNAKAEHYVDTHVKVMDTALANGDAKSLEVAARAAQWGMENIAHEGARILEKAPDSNTGGVKVLVGVKIGGLSGTPEVKQLTE